MLKKLLDGHIMCEPIVDENGKRGYRFSAIGTFDRLLTGVKVVNHAATYDGGGQAIQPSLAPLLPFEIRGVALAA